MKKLLVLIVILGIFSDAFCNTAVKAAQKVSNPKIPNQNYFGYEKSKIYKNYPYKEAMLAFMCSPADGPKLPYGCPDGKDYECIVFKSQGGVTKGRSTGICQPKLATVIKRMAKQTVATPSTTLSSTKN